MMGSRTMSASAFLLILLVLSWNCVAEATDTAADCCLTTKSIAIPRNLVKSYYIQTEEMGCRERATVFVTKKGKKLCAPPPSKGWVRKLIHKLEGKSKQKSQRQKPV